MDSINGYEGITDYYDLWVTSGYYDYQKIAEEILRTIGMGCSIIELGVGTGLLAEQCIKQDPSCSFSGIDISEPMLKIAGDRLGDQVELIHGDAGKFDVGKTFDVAVSNGGTWGVMDLGDSWVFGGHIPGIDANREGIINLGRHLKKGGLLLLHSQKPHEDYDKELSNGVIYTQSTEKVDETSEFYSFRKKYMFKKDDKTLAQDEILVTCINEEISKDILSCGGFDLIGSTDKDSFAIYQRV